MYKVLIVEDDPMVAMINEQYIGRNKNFRIVGKCRNGKAALEFLDKNKADLLILDVYMPLADGFETLRKIRSRKLPVEAIMVTAANDRESLEEALHLGIVDYLVKPFTFERFQMALEKFIAQHNAMKNLGTLDQKNIDFIVENARKKSEDIYPKGIQEKTLNLILEHLKAYPDKWLTGDEIAEKIALTGVTVRRYMNYLAESGKVTGRMNYETGGRPCMIYRIKEKPL